MVDNVAGSKLVVYLLERDTRLGHQHHNVVSEVCYLVDSLGLVLGFCRDYDLGRLLADFLQDLVKSLFKKSKRNLVFESNKEK